MIVITKDYFLLLVTKFLYEGVKVKGLKVFIYTVCLQTYKHTLNNCSLTSDRSTILLHT